MHEITPEAQRQALAQQHRQSLANAPQRSRRQAARLHLLQLWGQRYPKAAPAAPQRILVIRPDHLGDLLFSTPALHLLRASFPDAHMAALVGPWGEAVLAGNPDLDETIPCPFPGFTRQPKGSPLEPYRLLRREAHRLAAMQFDLALVLRFDHWWGGWLAAAAGIPQRLGYAIAEVQPFLTRAIPYVRGRHEVVQNLALALAAGEGERLAVNGERLMVNGEWLVVNGKRLGRSRAVMDSDWRLRFAVTAEDEARAAALLPPADRPVVAIHPGSGAAVKRWRATAWAELAGRLAAEHGTQVIFTGSAGEAELIDPVLALLAEGQPLSPAAISLAGQTSLGGLAAVYRRCSLVIGPDSGPLHLAVAAGTPTVHLYGPVDRRTFGPWGDPQRHVVVTSDWSCIACNRLDWPDRALSDHGCVRDIPVAQVAAAAARLLRTGRQR